MSAIPEACIKQFVDALSAQQGKGVVLAVVNSASASATAAAAASDWLKKNGRFLVDHFEVKPGRLALAKYILDQSTVLATLRSANSDAIPVMHVHGMDCLSKETLDDLCEILNRDRDILASLPLVTVFWVNDKVLGALSRCAPFFVAGPFPVVDLSRAFGADEKMKVGRERLVEVMLRFPRCIRRERRDLPGEAAVQRILWTMLQAHYDDVVDEGYLPKTGIKHYRYDIGIRHLRTIVEVKFVRPSMNLGKLQDDLLADTRGYFAGTSEFDKVVIFIYDASSRQADWQLLREAFELLPEVLDVIVIPYVRLGGAATKSPTKSPGMKSGK